MTGPTRPPSGGAPLQPWNPEQAPKGVTCPTCGLQNEPGARVCRNCGLPVAAAGDPLRGVAPGHVEMPSARRAGISATLGLIVVIGLLVISGTLAVSGGGILNSGGRIGVGSDASPSPSAGVGATTSNDLGEEPLEPVDSLATPAPDTRDESDRVGAVTPFTCSSTAIRDPESAKWRISRSAASVKEGNDRFTFAVEKRAGKSATGATTVRMEWVTPRQARQEFGIERLPGKRALVITFEGPVTVSANSVIESADLEAEGLSSMRHVEVFVGDDKNVRAVIGVSGEGCARLASPQWKKKGADKRANIFLDLQPA